MTSSRREVTTADQPPGSMYPVLNAVVNPRPIAWVSSVSESGVDNLAPHSFFTVASADPPVVSFTSVGEKDTLRNVRATKEFVVSVVTRALFDECNSTGTNYPPGLSEFDEVGLEREPSKLVRPPRVALSPCVLECRYVGEHSFGASVVVFGEVLLAAFDETVLAEDGLPDVTLVQPLSRMARNEWGTVGEVLRKDRHRYKD